MYSMKQTLPYAIFSAILFSAFISGTEVHELRKTDASSSSKDTGFFWHLSDIHWDQDYSDHGDPKRMCHEFPDYKGLDETGKFGNFYCDAPWSLVNASIQAMLQLKSNPDFILWTGDNSPHTYNPTPDWKYIFTGMKKISLLLSKNFPGVPILPVIGNHDTQPPDVIKPNSSRYDEYLIRGGWDLLLPSNSTARETFGIGGYYNVTVGSRLQVVGLNTLLWWQRNKEVADLPDPAGQFAWLEGVLEDASQKGTKVYIIGHVPPGFYARTSPEKERVVYYPKFNAKYIDLINKYQHVITGQLYGHQHYDTFMLFQDENDKPTGTILLGPSVTPWHSIWPKEDNSSVSANPAVRLFTYARPSGTLLDYEQYYLNLTQANENVQTNQNTTTGNVTWELLYRFSTEYKLANLTAQSMTAHYERIANDDDTYKKYIYFTTSAKDVGPCEGFCRMCHLCSIRYTSENAYYKCMNKTADNTTVTTEKHENQNIEITGATKEATEIPKASTTRFPHRRIIIKDDTAPIDNSNRTASVEGIVIGCIACTLVLVAIIATAWWRHKRSAYVVRYMPFA